MVKLKRSSGWLEVLNDSEQHLAPEPPHDSVIIPLHEAGIAFGP